LAIGYFGYFGYWLLAPLKREEISCFITAIEVTQLLINFFRFAYTGSQRLVSHPVSKW